ncbi:hypothetical protein QFC24_002291 [Naganishia onofrii]|uniref:Uncharacterized protein n=1 Tax=Naganishia onofrii TaxID=1851511 RepID=A0ACC2XRC9_9TREE|nr:hypothetical protein QFC24_002291 [Naganishia onofrii]
MFRFALRTASPTAPSVGRTFSTTPVAFKAQTVQEINAKAKQLGIPPPPKAPLGAYAEFFRELYPKIRDNYVRENGRIDSHEVARVAGAQWNTLTEDDRKKYNQAAKHATDKYKLDYKRYYESLSPSQVVSLGIDSPETKGLKRGARNAANRALRGEAARPAGSFFIFLHEFRKSDELKRAMEKDGIDGAKSAIYTAKKAGEKWALMSPEDKQVGPRFFFFAGRETSLIMYHVRQKYVDQSVQQRTVYAEWKEAQEKKV